MDDFYDILGVTFNASNEEIKEAYKEKAKTLHPDVGGNAEEFIKIQLAYSTLIDGKKRKIYDVSDSLNIDAFNAMVHEKMEELVIKIISSMDDKEDLESIDILSILEVKIKSKIAEYEELLNKINNEVSKLNVVRDRLKPSNNNKQLYKKMFFNHEEKLQTDSKTLNYYIILYNEILSIIGKDFYNVS